jgi:hypothetical protein
MTTIVADGKGGIFPIRVDTCENHLLFYEVLFTGIFRAGSSDGRASPLQGEGHRFKSCPAYQWKNRGLLVKRNPLFLFFVFLLLNI